MSFQPEPGAKPPYLVITMEEGLIQTISSPDPRLQGLPVAIIDYDVDYAQDDEITSIPQGEGKFTDAFVHTDLVGFLFDEIDADITRITDGEIK